MSLLCSVMAAAPSTTGCRYLGHRWRASSCQVAVPGQALGSARLKKSGLYPDLLCRDGACARQMLQHVSSGAARWVVARRTTNG